MTKPQIATANEQFPDQEQDPEYFTGNDSDDNFSAETSAADDFYDDEDPDDALQAEFEAQYDENQAIDPATRNNEVETETGVKIETVPHPASVPSGEYVPAAEFFISRENTPYIFSPLSATRVYVETTKHYVARQVSAGRGAFLRENNIVLRDELNLLLFKTYGVLEQLAKDRKEAFKRTEVDESGKRRTETTSYIKPSGELTHEILPPSVKPRAFSDISDLPAEIAETAFIELYKPVLVLLRNALGVVTSEGIVMRYVDDEHDRDYGIYVSVENAIERFLSLFGCNVDERRIGMSIGHIRARIPERSQSHTRGDVVALANGLFSYKEQKLSPFTPDVILTTKLAASFDPNATLPVIDLGGGATWDPESWILELACGDKDLSEQMWQVISMALRPQSGWGALVDFYAPQGNNGKGTLLQLVRNLVGSHNDYSLNVASMGKEFYLENLLPTGGSSPCLISADENAESFVKDPSALKALTNGDVLNVNRKFKKNMNLHWLGVVIQCFNSPLRVGSESDSVARRHVLIPFNAQFAKASRMVPGKSAEKADIKRDFINRPEVLAYVARRALDHSLTPAFYEVTESKASLDLVKEHQRESDSVLDFWEQFKYRFAWSTVPIDFAYEAYCGWMKVENPVGSPIKSTQFKRQIRNAVAADPNWDYGQFRVASKNMSEPEYMIYNWGLKNWSAEVHPTEMSKTAVSTPDLSGQNKYTGLIWVGGYGDWDPVEPSVSSKVFGPLPMYSQTHSGSTQGARFKAVPIQSPEVQQPANQTESAFPEAETYRDYSLSDFTGRSIERPLRPPYDVANMSASFCVAIPLLDANTGQKLEFLDVDDPRHPDNLDEIPNPPGFVVGDMNKRLINLEDFDYPVIWLPGHRPKLERERMLADRKKSA